MSILAINVGSTSTKYALFSPDLKEQNRGQVEDINQLFGLVSKGDLAAVGHRIVHGGTQFANSVIVDREVFTELEEVSQLAPLHNKPALEALKACMDTWGNVPQIACFDTTFFQKIPTFAKLYALPYELYEQYGIQRFGFHGLSHQSVAQKAARLLGKPLESLKLITCHLGGGCSITAIEDGQPIDTSMGFTPLEGLVMGTRSGDLDPAIVLYLQREAGMSVDQVEEILQDKSGLLGVSGVSSDSRELVAASRQVVKDKEEPSSQAFRSGLALQMYAYRIKKYIGAYYVALGGLDALVFTGAVGVGADFMREMVTNGLQVLGNFETLVIEPNEELMIAREVTQLLVGSGRE